jgi:preprotein translocase subunit YajC
VSLIYSIIILFSAGFTAEADAPATTSTATTATAAPSAPAAPDVAKGDKAAADTATAVPGKAGAAAGNPPAGNGDQGGSILPYTLIIIVVLGYFLIVAPERKKSRAYKDQMSAIKKNDRVVTIGGIYGVVANINREQDKITLKVDDNTKMDFTLGAISRVVSAETPDKDKDKDAPKS